MFAALNLPSSVNILYIILYYITLYILYIILYYITLYCIIYTIYIISDFSERTNVTNTLEHIYSIFREFVLFRCHQNHHSLVVFSWNMQKTVLFQSDPGLKLNAGKSGTSRTYQDLMY